MNLRLAASLLAALAPLAAAACIDGVPAGLEALGPSKAQMLRSSWSQDAGEVRVIDSAGAYVRGAQVAFVLPDALDATFQDGTKRALGTTHQFSCAVSVPWFVAPSSLGIVKMRVELVANPAIWKEIAYGVSAPPASFGLYAEQLPRGRLSLAKAGQAHPAAARATVSSQQWPHGWSGVPVTFTLPEHGPSATFAGGARSVTVNTDAFGDAHAPEMIANEVLGPIRLKVSAPGAPDFTLVRYANVGPTQTQSANGYAYTMKFPGAFFEVVHVGFVGYPCGIEDAGPADPILVVRANGKPFASAAQPISSSARDAGCDASGNLTLPFRPLVQELSFGRHEISVGFEGDGVFDSSESGASFILEVLPHDTGTTMAGGVAWQAGVMPHRTGDAHCSLSMRSVGAGGSAGAPPPPANVGFPWGAFRYTIEDCSAGKSEQRIVMEFDSAVPAGAKVLWYGARPGDSQAKWQEVQSSHDGGRLQLVVGNAGTGDAGDESARALQGVVALAVPAPGSAPGSYQDLWWGGPSQSGWGVGIAQRDAQLFVTLYAYDDAGVARWWVIPDGSWDPGFTTYTGSVYQPSWPSGSMKMIPGVPVGTMALQFHSPREATMRYEIAGRTGERAIVRQPLGELDAGVRWNHAGMWWYGPHANGRGVFLAQQGSTMFAVQYDYERTAAGLTTWSVIPGGRWARDRVFVASGWFGASGPTFFAGYDPGAVVVERFDQARMQALATDRFLMYLGTYFDVSNGPSDREWEIVRQPF